MRMRKSAAVDGHFDPEGKPLRDGVAGPILLPDAHETFRLGPDAERELLASIAEVERGEVISGEDLLLELDLG